MRTTFCNSFGTILLVAIVIISCENNNNKDITYPVKSKFGMNLLSDSVSEILNYIPDSFMYPYPDYSLTAVLESESSLKVILSKEGDCSVIPKYGCTFSLWTRFPIILNSGAPVLIMNTTATAQCRTGMYKSLLQSRTVKTI